MTEPWRIAAYWFLLSYTAILIVSLWGIIYAIGRTLTSRQYPTYSSIVAENAGMRLFQFSVFSLGVVWFYLLYNYWMTPRTRRWNWNVPLYRLVVAAGLFWSLVGVNLVGPSWAVLHEVLTWCVYVFYVVLVQLSVWIHVWDTMDVMERPKSFWRAFRAAGKYRGWAIVAEEAFLVVAVVVGALAFKLCTTDSECRQTYEFVSATFLSCFSVFYYMEIQVADPPPKRI